MRTSKDLRWWCAAAALAGLLAAAPKPAEAWRANGGHAATATQVDAAMHDKAARKTRSIPQRKRSRCTG